MPTATVRAGMSLPMSDHTRAVVEQAAAVVGQPLDEYLTATLVGFSEAVLRQTAATAVSERDWQRLNSLLDDPSAQSNEALVGVAERYAARSI